MYIVNARALDETICNTRTFIGGLGANGRNNGCTLVIYHVNYIYMLSSF